LGCKDEEDRAKNIFLFTLIISLVINGYFIKRNYNELKSAKYNVNLYQIRLLGRILIFVGFCMSLYFQLKSTSDQVDL